MYTCDWPASGGVCGKQAFWFTDSGRYHRPLCAAHAQPLDHSPPGIQPIKDIDSAKVPQKIPTQAERDGRAENWGRERARLDADGTAQPKTVIEGVHAVDDKGRIDHSPERWVVREVVDATGARIPFSMAGYEPYTPASTAPPPSASPPLSRPPLREALADVALAILQLAKKRIEEETKR
jgi:hypothetical protein